VSNNNVVRGFHEAILSTAREKLGRTSRGGLVALEMILDTARADTAAEIERHLNSE